ncbi:troponin C-like [Protopterus annectens]|uniref:troponin C-like n=1 Tax=Protopterus annectens TaxID=7888 RepID=UPI001CF98F02|nr:troponin C-like [Protopterus annectens]
MGIHISYPLAHEPIRYSDDSDSDEYSEAAAQQIHEINLKYCDDIIQQRQHSLKAQKLFEECEARNEGRTAEILKKYPIWEVEDIVNLKLQFQLLDSNMDYLLDFEDINNALTEAGDESTEQERRMYFHESDQDGLGFIDFEAYLEVW